MKTSTILLIIGIVSIVLCFPSGYFAFKTESYCGVVIAKYSTVDASRHKSTVTLNHNDYIALKTTEGVYEKKSVTFNTYMSSEIGDRICFDRNKYPCYTIIIFIVIVMGSFIGFLGYWIESE